MLISRIYDFKAEFYDIDSMGVMWHGNYVKCVEVARCRFLDEVGALTTTLCAKMALRCRLSKWKI